MCVCICMHADTHTIKMWNSQSLRDYDVQLSDGIG